MRDRRVGINVFSGNMPFLGGRRIALEHGEIYAAWLTQQYGGTGDTDYVGYFLLRANRLLPHAGTVGFIATSAIADGDNRRTVLAPLMQSAPPLTAYCVTTGVPWSGNAQVRVSILHLARNLPSTVNGPKSLNGRQVAAINSRLRSGQEWPMASPLEENDGLALVGCFLRGDGFILEDERGRAFLREHPAERDVVRPFLTGDDLNNSHEQRAQRHVIDFRDMTLEEARRYPHALAIVEREVRPKREKLKTTGADLEHKRYWWRFANVRLELRARASKMARFIVAARVSKRTVFAFVPSSWIPSEQVVVFPLPTGTAFAVLQSRIHRVWITLQASHMGEGIRYSATDCFAPFPFPTRNPTTTHPVLEGLGEEIHEMRAKFCRTRHIGLTQAYNALHDPDDVRADVVTLRRLHEQLDREVLDAYGWTDLEVPDYASSVTAAEYQVFEDAVAQRLFTLNAQRAEQVTVSPPRPGRAAGPGPRKAAAQVMSPAKRARSRSG